MLAILVLAPMIILPFVFAITLAVGLTAFGMFRVIFMNRPKVDLDDLADKVVRNVAIEQAYNCRELAVVPVLGARGAWHVVMRGRREQIVTVVGLAMLHSTVLGHLMACHH